MELKHVIHLVEAFKEFQPGDWVWCLHCERCYQVGEFRLDGDYQMCPYDGCSGSTVLDGMKWRGALPPERGRVYPIAAVQGKLV